GMPSATLGTVGRGPGAPCRRLRLTHRLADAGRRYDGALGVIGALVALRTLRERFGRPRQTIEAVSLCEEEASRFHATNFWGSRAVNGDIEPAEAERMRDFDGLPIAEAMRAVGLIAGARSPRRR